ncbi:VUT family protein [Streptomyces stelliscabiei]|uniref:Uncharacterized PurR-regulated membrane protein YhhQ (DUF165 family) n=1 Tax=Streptomyces stelliscabiei TaxID=146820 RepID=A0A8I0TR15_9ACTN|nr:VUT family protein [Streptomyces stelliscabiei]KND45326.1 membrane protein [Streptomyces stelliscabiei]MBE1597169.1 uncharacterized PurR-regulated membrane protein YhhQ (DUF165 family) [Streptomyces stelliscabiei]MDX2513877.1 VUT family protein [Streptomyces stelliscabiei]MDX2550161.1 VUT family protein [Streptomyces stelliscabiei]
MNTRRTLALTAYILAIAAANWLTTRYGIVPTGFGLATTAGTYAAGLALLLRDVVQDYAGTAWVFVGIAAGGALTAVMSPALAVASVAAFVLAELFDWGVYTPLRSRGWARAALLSGIVGAIVDTAVFLRLAPFPFEWPVFWGQLVGKALWATLLPVLLVVAIRQVRRGPVSRHSVGA